MNASSVEGADDHRGEVFDHSFPSGGHDVGLHRDVFEAPGTIVPDLLVESPEPRTVRVDGGEVVD